MRILDTHLHLIYPDRFDYPWLAGNARLNRPWSHESYVAEAVPLGIESALHMEVDVAEADSIGETEFVLGLPRIAGAIAACRPEHMNFVDQIEQLSEHAHVKGVRRILHELPDDLSQSDLFIENLRHLPDYDLSFDLCLRADQLHLGVDLAQKAPDVSFILDHCGNPDIAGSGLDPWRVLITAIARNPNVSGKISGLVNHCAPGWSAETLRPYVEHMVEAFGWDRVVWGSDHPVATLTGGTLTDWVTASRTIVGGCSEDEQAKLFHRNAERIYKV
ncbi:MAG TPA: amidohydrolase [Devosia sp.]|jgi:predicted TIM-barrel fold metal-dependent hydrolase|nr:amidohydrolase [Devosia sp.]